MVISSLLALYSELCLQLEQIVNIKLPGSIRITYFSLSLQFSENTFSSKHALEILVSTPYYLEFCFSVLLQKARSLARILACKRKKKKKKRKKRSNVFFLRNSFILLPSLSKGAYAFIFLGNVACPHFLSFVLPAFPKMDFALTSSEFYSVDFLFNISCELSVTKMLPGFRFLPPLPDSHAHG